MAAPKKQLHLKIVFDTNVIYNHSSSDLMVKETAELIEKHSNPADIKISWHIPQIVLNERRFQMRKRGAELLPSLEKLEKLLGHNLGINYGIIETRIEEAIGKSITKYNLEIENIIVNKVNWEDIMNSASYRLPPFDDNKTEKGFRDSLILETLIQLIANSPASMSSCRIIFITNDKLLIEATKLKIIGSKNVSIINSIEELESLINILDSKVKEELVNSVSKQAGSIFFIPSNTETLYYKDNINRAIISKFAKEINELPKNADKREDIQWLISSPGFEKKVKQRIFWKTVITLKMEAFTSRRTYPVTPKSEMMTFSNNRFAGNILNNLPIGSSASVPLPRGGIRYPLLSTLYPELNDTQSSMPIQISKELVSTGTSKFEIIWSVTLTTKETLINPKIEEINFLETIWTEHLDNNSF